MDDVACLSSGLTRLSKQPAALGPQESLPFLSLICVLVLLSQGTGKQSWLLPHSSATIFREVAEQVARRAGSYVLPNLFHSGSSVYGETEGASEGVWQLPFTHSTKRY